MFKSHFRAAYSVVWFGICGIGFIASCSIFNSGYIGTPAGWEYVNAYSATCIIIYISTQFYLGQYARSQGEIFWDRNNVFETFLIIREGGIIWHFTFLVPAFIWMSAIPIWLVGTFYDATPAQLRGVHIYQLGPSYKCSDVWMIETNRYLTNQEETFRSSEGNLKTEVCVSHLEYKWHPESHDHYVNIYGHDALSSFFVKKIETVE